MMAQAATLCTSPSCKRWAKRPCAMSLEFEIKSGSLERGRFRYFPVVPGRLEFACELRRVLLDQRPAIVAVELPGFLADIYRRALARLPEITVVLYADEADEERAVYV